MDDRDRQLIESAGHEDMLGRRAFAELVVGVRDALVAQGAVTAALNARMERLNVWLLLLTVATVVLTAVQVGIALAASTSEMPSLLRTWGTPRTLNTVGLALGVVAGLLMACFPPRVQQYTAEGGAVLTFHADPTWKWWGRCQKWISIGAPLLLGLAFLIQLLALVCV